MRYPLTSSFHMLRIPVECCVCKKQMDIDRQQLEHYWVMCSDECRELYMLTPNLYEDAKRSRAQDDQLGLTPRP